MQDKVHSAPPPVIKMVEGKPPPNSWVTENIVQYLQDRTQASFLKDVLLYVKSLQSEQLAQMKSKVLSLEESFAGVPEEGTADEIAQSSLFNSTQGLIKTQMESLEKLILLLSQADPKFAAQGKAMLAELQKMALSFPGLSPGQMQNLNTILQELSKYASRLPAKDQRAFWNSQINMLKSMMEQNKGNMQEYQDEIKELQAKIQMLEVITQQLKEMQKALTATPPSPKQFQSLIENLQSLANRFGELNFEQQQAVGSLFQQLGQFKTKSGESLTQVIADALIHGKLAACLQANPKANSGQCAAFLKAFLKESNLQSSNLSFLKSLGDTVEDVLSKKGFPETEGYSGESFATSQNGKIQLNEGFQNGILATYSPDPSSVAALEKSSNDLTQAASTEINLSKKKVQGLSETLNSLSTIQEHVGKGAAWAVGQSYSAGKELGAQVGDSSQSLPNQFSNAIINHYMPGQQAYLEQLAMMLFLDNQGAEFGNTLLNTIRDFNGAATNYDFSNSLHPDGGPNTFSGSVTNAQNQLNNEKNSVNGDINADNTAYNQAQNAIDKIKAQMKGPPPPSPDQMQILQNQLSSLQQFQGDLKVSLAQLNQLKSVLDSIRIGPAKPPNDDPTKHYEVYGVGGPGDPPPFPPPANWQTDLSNGERLVINGDQNAKPPAYQGGLVNIASEITAFQQNYSDQGQNQQMMLQMRMTEIQQEWTVVSTALQLLNQMYMSVAQGIYK